MKFDWEDPEDWNSLSIPERVAMLKTTVSMVDMVELCGHDVTKDKVRPPWNPTERTPSTHLYEDHFYDYASGKHGDIFDWLAEEDIAQGEEPRPLPKAVSYIRKLALRGGREPGDVDAQPVRNLEQLLQHLPHHQVDTLLGLDVRGYGLHQTAAGDVYVPHYEYRPSSGVLVYGIKIRYAHGSKGSVPGSQFTHRLYDPYGWVDADYGDTCVITEGESDCWALISTFDRPGLHRVLALPSGSSAWKDHWLEDLAPYGTVYVCFDNDRAGKQATEKVMRKIGYDRAKELRVPQLYNDVREAVEAGWRPFLG